jgi:hypothetical protein
MGQRINHVGHGNSIDYNQDREDSKNYRPNPENSIDRLIDCLQFYVPLKNCLLLAVTIAGEGQKKLGLCSAFRAFEQEGIFILPHL